MAAERENNARIFHVLSSNKMLDYLTSIRMLRVRTPVRSTMPIHVATVVAPSSAASATTTTAASRAASSAARPREEPSPAAVGVVLVAEAAHDAADAAGAAEA